MRDGNAAKKPMLAPNPKGKIGSTIALAMFGLFIAVDWWKGPLYMMPLFVLFEALSGVRCYQEWVEAGLWAR